jgi:hypothetical protein
MTTARRARGKKRQDDPEFFLPEIVYQRLLRRAQARGVTVSDMIREAVYLRYQHLLDNPVFAEELRRQRLIGLPEGAGEGPGPQE